jgi:hypothetical protein
MLPNSPNREVRPDQAAQVQQDVDNYRRFQTLAEEFVTRGEQIPRKTEKTPAAGSRP